MTQKFLNLFCYYLAAIAPLLLFYTEIVEVKKLVFSYLLVYRPLIDGLYLTYITKLTRWDYYIPLYSHTKYFRIFLGGKL